MKTGERVSRDVLNYTGAPGLQRRCHPEMDYIQRRCGTVTANPPSVEERSPEEAAVEMNAA